MNLLQRKTGRVVLFTCLYVSEGAPIGFIWWALPTILRMQGVPVGKITSLVAVLVWPWVFKFLWAPLVDSLRTKRWGFRSWIMSTQVCMGLSLLPLFILDPIIHLRWWITLLFVHAFAAATQDVSVDAMAIKFVPQKERGAINGFMQAGMLAGRSIFGGGALLLMERLGMEWMFAGLIACIWISLILLFFIQEPNVEKNGGIRERYRQFTQTLQRAFARRNTWFALLFALLSGAAFEAVGAMAGPYMVDRGVPQETIGLFFGTVVVGAMMIGALIGGPLSDRIGRARAVGFFLTGFVVWILALGVVDNVTAGSSSPPVLLGLLAGMYLFIGLFTAASYALFMDLTDPRLGATQFSTFMAATNGCESWSAWAGGKIASSSSYPLSFFSMCTVSLLSLIILRSIAVPFTDRSNGRNRKSSLE